MKTFKKILFDDLKQNKLGHLIPKIKSVKSDLNSVDIKTVNIFKKDRESLESFLNRYSKGYFDGMTDMYEYYQDKPHLERMFKYVFLKNDFDENITKEVKQILEHDFGVIDDQTSMKVFNRWFDQVVWTELQKKEK